MLETSPFITASIPYLTAFLAGLFGGVHCVGMCGGVTGAMVYGIPSDKRHGNKVWPYLFAYNFGRVATYSLLGILLGLLGSQGGELIEQYNGWIWMRVVAGILMIAMGLYLAGWWAGLVQLEKLGGMLIWQRIQPLSKRILPVQSPAQAMLFGLVWGLLPCGLIYTMLVWSLAAGGWWQGGAFLLSFGIGTLPTLFAAGWFANRAGQVTVNISLRRLAGILVMLFGIWTVTSSLLGQINVGLGCLPPT